MQSAQVVVHAGFFNLGPGELQQRKLEKARSYWPNGVWHVLNNQLSHWSQAAMMVPQPVTDNLKLDSSVKLAEHRPASSSRGKGLRAKKLNFPCKGAS